MTSFDTISRPLDERQEYVKELEPEYKIPETWGIGPVRNKDRRCTDMWCYILFIMTLIAMIAFAIWALSASDPRGISKVYDSSGNICGKDNAADYPLLYLQTFEKPYRSVCVSACPQFDYNQIHNYGLANTDPASQDPMDFQEFSAQYAGNSYTTSADMTEHEAFAYNPSWSNNYFTQAQWDGYTKGFKLDCLPNKQFGSCQSDNAKFFAYDSYPVLGKVCTPLTPKISLMFTKVEQSFSNGNFQDVGYAAPIYGWVSLAAFGLSFFFLLIMCICPGLISYLLFIVFGLALLALGILIFISYGFVGHLNDPQNALRVKYLNYILAYKIPILIFASLSIVLGFLIFYMMCKYRRHISSAIPLLQFASKSSLRNFMLIILSVVILIVSVGVFVLETYIIIKIYSTGEENTDFANGQPYATYDMGPIQIVGLILHIFGAYWLIVSLNNFNDFVTAAVSVNYFFHGHTWREIFNLNVFCHSLGHHVGTVNYSLFYLPAVAFKLVFGPLDWITASDKPNGLQRCIRKLCCCCFNIYDRAVKPFFAHIYPLTYMGSEDFCKVTKRHFYLTERYHDVSDTILMVGEFFALSAKILIMIATSAIGYLIYKNRLDYQQNISNVGLMFFIMAFMGYIVGSLCINLFATTYEADVFCWLIELDLKYTSNGNYKEKVPEDLKNTFAKLEELRSLSASRTYRPLN